MKRFLSIRFVQPAAIVFSNLIHGQAIWPAYLSFITGNGHPKIEPAAVNIFNFNSQSLETSLLLLKYVMYTFFKFLFYL